MIEDKIIKIETTLQMFMEQTKEQMKKLEFRIDKGFNDMISRFESQDKEYNNKFATKKELDNIHKLSEKGKLMNNPVVWVIIVTIITAITNIFINKFFN